MVLPPLRSPGLIVRFLLVPLCILASGCSKFEVTSKGGDGVPEFLLGGWSGSWSSAVTTSGGALEVQLQEFGDEPIVTVSIDNPCLPPQQYEFLWEGALVELRSAGQTILRGEIAPDRTMSGTYSCASDSGTWSTEWTRELPVILDLSGSWHGTVETTGASTPLQFILDQQVRDGSLSLRGVALFPGIMSAPLPLVGGVRFREDAFDVLLDTTAGVLPQIQLIGVGLTEPISAQGLLMTSGGPLPASGVWQAAPLPE